MPISDLGSNWEAERVCLGRSNDFLGVADEVMLNGQVQERIETGHCRLRQTELYTRASGQAVKLLIRDRLRQRGSPF